MIVDAKKEVELMAHQGRYVLNTNSKKIHDTSKKDKRCKLNLMKPECVKYFDSIEDAMKFPNSSTPLAKPCRFCIGDSTKE